MVINIQRKRIFFEKEAFCNFTSKIKLSEVLLFIFNARLITAQAVQVDRYILEKMMVYLTVYLPIIYILFPNISIRKQNTSQRILFSPK